MIVPKSDHRVDLVIDLTGPQGNAFYLLGIVRTLACQIGKDPAPIIDEMMEADYEKLVGVFDREFGNFVTLVR